MIELSRNEARVLGVLIEKAQTTPQQYPLSLNGAVSGCNQKSNRHPVMTLSEDEVFDALESLRVKGLVRELMLAGSRVAKYRHIARETLDVDTNELVLLAELLMRGPQTLGELRGRASRMHPIESLDICQNIIQHLMDREEPMVKPIAPEPGSRAGRFMQLLSPNLHRIDESNTSNAAAGKASQNSERQQEQPSDTLAVDQLARLEARIEALEAEMQLMKSALGG